MKRILTAILILLSFISFGQNQQYIDSVFSTSKVYKDRFVRDTGTMYSDRMNKAYLLMAEKEGISDNVAFGWFTAGATKGRAVGSLRYLTKMYNIYGANDAVQTTSDNQPLISADGYLEKSGESNSLTIPALTVAGTVTVVNRTNGDIVITHTDVSTTISSLTWTGDLYAYIIRDEVLSVSEKAAEVEFFQMLYPSFDFASTVGWQGLAWNSTTDAYTRLGSISSIAVGQSALTANLPIQGAMRRCLLLNNGTVNYYLDAANSALKADGVTASVLTGADGQVMVEIPKFYYAYKYSGGVHYWAISLTKLSGMQIHPAFIKDGVEVNYRYYSAFEGALWDNSESAYCAKASIHSNIYAAGDKLCSVSGQWAKVSETLAEYRAAAVARGTGWRTLDFTLNAAVQMLYLIEYADFDTQTMIGMGRTQLSGGGWTADSYIGATGLSISKGNTSFSVSTGGTGGYLTDYMTYRGIENWYGNVWKDIDGIAVDGTFNSTPQGFETYVTNNIAYLNNQNGTNKQYIGTMPYIGIETGDYGKNIAANPYFIVSEKGGSSSTYLCDYYYQYDAAAQSAWRLFLFGGNAGGSVTAGGFAVTADAGWSAAYVFIAARLAY